MRKLRSTTLVVLASIYPRWTGDSVPNFVENFVRQLKPWFQAIHIIVPHYRGAQRTEHLDSHVSVTRFRYAYPYRYENIAYGEVKRNFGYPFKLGLFVASEMTATLMTCLRSKHTIINAHWLLPQGLAAVLVRPLAHTKVVVSAHGPDVFTRNGPIKRRVKRFILRHADVVVANSSATREACNALYPRDYPIIPIGVDMQRFSRQKFLEDHETLELLFVGRLVEEKGILYLCQAVGALYKQRHKVHLTIVGDGPLLAQLQHYVTDNHLGKGIAFAGWVSNENLTPYYERADVFIGPSVEQRDGWREAFGVVFAEASAMGLPVITTDTGGIRDIIKHEQNGLVVPQKDPSAIVEMIERLQADPKLRHRLGKNGHTYIQQHFSWDIITEKYMAIFESLAEE